MREDHLTRTFEEKVEALSVVKGVEGGSGNSNSIEYAARPLSNGRSP